MATCSSFRTFVNPVGVSSKLASVLPLSLNQANILTDIPHLSHWYWMLCKLTIDIFYTLNSNFPIHHSYTIDKTQVFPPQRILPEFTKFSLKQHDSDLEITTDCQLNLCDIYIDEGFINTYKRNNQNHQNDVLLPLQTAVGLSLNFVESADNGDFTISTLKNFSQQPPQHCLTTNFIGHPLTFYFFTEYPEDIEGHIDKITLTHEFFQIKDT